jgi:hypothetical protein
VWIAVLGSVKLFPNLEAALKGVFNRVLEKFTQSERALPQREVRVPCVMCSRKMLVVASVFQTPAAHTKVSHGLRSTQSQRRRQGRPPSRSQAQTRNLAVTAGALSHGKTAAHGCRLTACARTSPPARSIWPRWRASAHNSAGGWLQTRIA